MTTPQAKPTNATLADGPPPAAFGGPDMPDADHLEDALLAAAAEIQDRVGGFAADMKARGIHVGLGTGGPIKCVTCEQPWPCPQSGGQ